MNLDTPDSELINAFNLGNELAIEIIINKDKKKIFNLFMFKLKI